MAALAVAVLLPRRFHVSQDPANIVMWTDHYGAPKDKIERDLALWLGKKYDDNRRTVERLGGTCAASAVLVLIEIAALVLDLMTR